MAMFICLVLAVSFIAICEQSATPQLAQDGSVNISMTDQAGGNICLLYTSCPYLTSQKVLSGKWSMYILYLLTDGPIRFNELQRKMPEEMTHTTLSRQLKTLENEGLILRTEYAQIPPKVEYLSLIHI